MYEDGQGSVKGFEKKNTITSKLCVTCKNPDHPHTVIILNVDTLF